MPQLQSPWRHHYIPEFYLKRWCAVNGKLVEFSKPYRDIVKPKRASPRETGFIDRLYTLEGLPEIYSGQVESEFFRPVDGRAATVLQKMESNTKVLDAEERVAWTQFLISLIFRTPENISATQARLSESLLVTSKEAERRWRKSWEPGTPKSLREAMKQAIGDDPTRISRQVLEIVAGNSSSEKIANRIVSMSWGWIKMPLTVPGLYASDRPLHWYGGLEDENCHILMPLGPKRVFWATRTSKMAETILSQQPETIGRFLNDQTVRRARKYVYAMSDMGLKFVQEKMGTDQEASLTDLITTLPSDKELQQRDKRFNPSHARRSYSNAALLRPLP
ncbi:DUF4238 domain-containing protein [Methylobacterium sp. CM6247]